MAMTGVCGWDRDVSSMTGTCPASPAVQAGNFIYLTMGDALGLKGFVLAARWKR